MGQSVLNFSTWLRRKSPHPFVYLFIFLVVSLKGMTADLTH